jgi:hypothetical protein
MVEEVVAMQEVVAIEIVATMEVRAVEVRAVEVRAVKGRVAVKGAAMVGWTRELLCNFLGCDRSTATRSRKGCRWWVGWTTTVARVVWGRKEMPRKFGGTGLLLRVRARARAMK